MSIYDRTKEVFIQCEDCAERMAFMKHVWDDNDASFEFVIEDSYCGGSGRGFLRRLRRAWYAFWAKPIYHTGVYIDDHARVKEFLDRCAALFEEKSL